MNETWTHEILSIRERKNCAEKEKSRWNIQNDEVDYTAQIY